MNRIKKSCYNIFLAMFYSFNLIFKITPLLYILYIILVIINAIIPAIYLYSYKVIIDSVINIYISNYSITTIIYPILVYIILTIFNSQLDSLLNWIHSIIQDKVKLDVDSTIMSKYSEIDLQELNSPKNKELLDIASNSHWTIINSIFLPIGIIRNTIYLISTSFIFLNINTLLGVIYILISTPFLLIKNSILIKTEQFSLSTIKETRKKDYFKRILTDHEFAKEIRIYDTKTYFKQRFSKISELLIKKRKEIFLKAYFISFVSNFIYCITYAVIIYSMIMQSIQGFLTISDLTIFISGINKFYTDLSSCINFIYRQMSSYIPRILKYKKFLSIKDRPREGTLILDDTYGIDIIFEDVYFKYNTEPNYTLNGVTFHIAKGEKIALVGVNGSGKTTIIKLLLKIYEPIKGKILINNIDIKDYEVNSLYKIFGVCFQDVIKYALSLRENICLSHIDNLYDDKLILNTIKETEVDVFMQSLNITLETQLTRQFYDDGIDLSEGQWQKISISRCIFKNAKFLIMDEPASFLDSKSEDILFRIFNNLTCENGGILITHRLNGISFVDNIVVLDKGKVVEQGSHNELISSNGIYKKMYQIQCNVYK